MIVLRVGQSNEGLVRSLGVKKMRGTAVNPCEYPFNIVKGKGIVLLSSDKKPIVVQDVHLQGLEFFELPKD